MRGPLRELERDATELVEPTASAPVPASAIVRCVECKRAVLLAEADVVGLGYRCARCSLGADVGELSGVPDVVAHLSPEDRARFAERGRQLAHRGFVAAGLLVAAAILGFAIAPEGASLWLKLLLVALMVALGVGGLGLQRWRRFR